MIDKNDYKKETLVMSALYLPGILFIKQFWLIGVIALIISGYSFFNTEIFILCRKNIKYFSFYFSAFFIVLSLMSIALGLHPDNDLGTYSVIGIVILGMVVGYPLIFSKIKLT